VLYILITEDRKSYYFLQRRKILICEECIVNTICTISCELLEESLRDYRYTSREFPIIFSRITNNGKCIVFDSEHKKIFVIIKA